MLWLKGSRFKLEDFGKGMRDADKSQADPWVSLFRFKASKSDFGLKVLTEV